MASSLRLQHSQSAASRADTLTTGRDLPQAQWLVERRVMTETLHLFVGAILVVGFGLAFWLALPRDGKVRSFLRNDQVQAYYAVPVVSLLAGGVVSLLLVLMDVIG
jgi:sterol desaturase/sphingolipid hydroxylase (fatty acid hydroxylase superfamily)